MSMTIILCKDFHLHLKKLKIMLTEKSVNLKKQFLQENLYSVPSDFTDLIHTIQFELTDADISFTAPLAMNTQIKAGDVFVRDMFNLYRYENLLYKIQLSGEEIKIYLEYSYGNWFNQMKDENDHLLKFKKDENGNILYSERSNSPRA